MCEMCGHRMRSGQDLHGSGPLGTLPRDFDLSIIENGSFKDLENLNNVT